MPDTPVANSYLATVEEADALAATVPGSTAWTGSSKAAALQEATRRIDSLPLRGIRYEQKYIKNGVQYDGNSDGLTQVLEFPRYIDGVAVEWDHGTHKPIVPDLVKMACIMEAISILEFLADTDRSERRTMKDDGVQSYNLGGDYSETLGPSTMDTQGGLQSKVAWRLMKRYIGLEVR